MCFRIFLFVCTRMGGGGMRMCHYINVCVCVCVCVCAHVRARTCAHMLMYV